jgi:hypothetical protein
MLKGVEGGECVHYLEACVVIVVLYNLAKKSDLSLKVTMLQPHV